MQFWQSLPTYLSIQSFRPLQPTHFYGLPVSFLMTWIIYHTISNGLDTEFFIPWYSIAIAVGSVFLVVFATMLYSMGKIKKENTIDVLKNENV